MTGSRIPLTPDSERHLRIMEPVGLDILRKQDRASYHTQGFAQDVHGIDGQLIHAELSDTGIWSCTDAETGEFLGVWSVDLGKAK